MEGGSWEASLAAREVWGTSACRVDLLVAPIFKDREGTTKET